MHTEFWLTYHLASRAHLPATTQLIELEHQEHRLSDLEDVLEHVFRQGFVEPKHRPAAWWEKKDGHRVKASATVEELLNEGVGKCPDTALKLVVEDTPTALWFSYVYLHQPHAHVVAQRIKFAAVERKFERLAHVTNYVFAQGYLPCKYRPAVHWQSPCGKQINEAVLVGEILAAGDGVNEDKPLRLVIDDKLVHHDHHHHLVHTPTLPHHHHYYHHHECGSSRPGTPICSTPRSPIRTLN
ncbi:hypothetical protein AMATHDRAFT_59520 [Amanita thiersii Skay4041]|uniref:Uncharacterized protein n=1 Tax=Amanita thiersii Skay4041 TaxID=703135 RepID=A0A2A9NU85_9AGAR|nr:hypothetical protein AMATHDRAFT_59520 [Amanita thiersii Skay4041]